jgi:hypothetical protein
MKVISFFCDVDEKKFYENKSVELINMCKSLGVEHLVVEENFGKNWIDNVRAKPNFLLKMMNTLDHDFMWLDVDCYINKKIDFDFDCDWMMDFRPDGQPHDYVHIIKNTEKNKDFMGRWIQEIEEKKRGSHTAFMNIYKTLNYKPVPSGYVSLGLADVESKHNYFENGK